MVDRLGDAPIEPKFLEKMNNLARFLDKEFNGDGPRTVGFCLMLFDFGLGAERCNYISNANRKDVIVLLREQLRRFEGAPDVKGTV
jgi:hypothetical protein